MGSSLTVTPAADIPLDVGKTGKLVIVNLQSTPLDKFAYLRINGLCEDVMKRLAKKMELKVSHFILKRMINFRINARKEFEFRGIDKRGVPHSFFKNVLLEHGKEKKREQLKGEPYHFSSEIQKGKLNVELYGYLGEPHLVFDV